MRRCLGGAACLLTNSAFRRGDQATAALTASSRAQFDEAPDLQKVAGSTPAAAAPVPYRRRSSDPRTLRERIDFRRDHKYGRTRPLPDLPWRQQRGKTYLDDAERLYGRKEGWHTVEDGALREKLVAILQDYLRDTTASARLEINDARKYRRLCEDSAQAYRASLRAGAFGSPDMLRTWATGVLTLCGGRATGSGLSDAGFPSGAGGASEDGSVTALGGSDEASRAGNQGTGKELSDAVLERIERRRRRGTQANLDGSAALADLPDGDSRRAPQSAFPFLRQRAVSGEHTLDPSLVDWAARYFPEDDEATFREPPQLRIHAVAGSDTVDATGNKGDFSEGEREDSSNRSAGAGSWLDSPPARARGAAGDAPRLHARHRLHRSLRAHEDRRRATFDAEGVFYHLRQQSDADERAPRPRPVRGSEVSVPGARQSTGVVKVPWGIVSASKQQGYTPDILRAKERLLRLSRGEDPETIP